MQGLLVAKEALSLKQSGEGYMEGFGGRKGKAEM